MHQRCCWKITSMRVWSGRCLLESGHLHRNKVDRQARRPSRRRALSGAVSHRTDYMRFKTYLSLLATAGISGAGEIEIVQAPACKATGVAMPQFQSIPHSQDIVHPTCPKCGAPMWLTRIEPDEPGSEKRIFECQACQNELVEVIKFR